MEKKKANRNKNRLLLNGSCMTVIDSKRTNLAGGKRTELRDYMGGSVWVKGGIGGHEGE